MVLTRIHAFRRRIVTPLCQGENGTGACTAKPPAGRLVASRYWRPIDGGRWRALTDCTRTGLGVAFCIKNMPRIVKAKSRALTIYLLKQDQTSETAFKEVGSLSKFSVADGLAVGDLYLSVASPRPPQWASLFKGLTLPTLPQLSGTPSSAVLLVKRKGRLFALTFGYGRHLLAPGTFEENFGLIVTLNVKPRPAPSWRA